MTTDRHEQSHILITGRTLHYHASDVRRERTGVHARVGIALDTQVLAWSVFNVERDEDRTRLANSASKRLGNLDRESLGTAGVKEGLDAFCAGLWEAQIGTVDVGSMEGEQRIDGSRFHIRPFVIGGGGSIVYAPPGRGKSFTGLLMTVSIDAGTRALFPVEEQVASLYINLERSKASLLDRLARVNAALGLEPTRPLHMLNARGRSLSDVLEAARRHIDRYKIGFVMLDSISRAGYGDLNENQSVNRIIDALNGLCESWGGLAHTPRQDESHIFGGVHFDAGMDIGIQLVTQAEGSTIGVGLKVTKANDAPLSRDPFVFALDFSDTGLHGVRPATLDEFPQLAAGTKQALRLPEAIMAYLMRFGASTTEQVAKETGFSRSKVSEFLNAHKGVDADRVGRTVTYRVRATDFYE